MTSTTTIHSSPEQGGQPMLRVDSPLSFSAISPISHAQRPNDTMATLRENPEPKKIRQPATRKQAKISAPSASLRFFVVDHPTKLKDKDQLKQNRKHVMHDYLDKERRNPGSTDARVTGAASGRKRKRVDPQLTGTSVHLAFPANTFTAQQLPVSQALRGELREMRSVDPQPTNKAPFSSEDKPLAKLKATPQRPIIFANDLSPLVHGLYGDSNYLATSLNDVPDPTAPIGSNLNPFDTWPQMASPLVNVEKLKWSCSRNFGTQGIAAHWVPALLKAKHAFLSTLCISSSHEDIMQRGLQQPHERLPFGSIERWTVRGEVISMINNAMRDPELRATDATIVAVLHLLNSEIMGCDDVTMAIHQRGLHDMISERGGLNHLGVDGQLASILTITMHLISALRETEPHSDFVRYAEKKDIRPPTHERQLPESPAYCRLSGYITIRRVIAPAHPTLELLEDLRCLTNQFNSASSSPILSAGGKQAYSIHQIYQKISATKPAKDRPQDFSSIQDSDRFEALRLVAQVYSHALFHQIPLSKAASQLANQYDGTSWHIHIKQILIRTDLSDCWGHLAGVLFWMTLVAGACANPDSPSNKPRRELSPEEEETRKWLAAIAVRCSIVLSFEYGGAILQTLKVMVGIEQALAGFDADRSGREVQRVVIGGVTMEDPSAGMFGPAERPLPQRTFQDYAQDFMGDFA